MRPSAGRPGRTNGAGDGGLALPRAVLSWPEDAREELEERISILMDSRMSESRATAAAIDIVAQRRKLPRSTP